MTGLRPRRSWSRHGQPDRPVTLTGGIRGGTVVGSTNAKAEHPLERPLMPHDLLATVYKVMGIDTQLSFKDFAGRPVPILTEGEPIRELL